MPSTRYPRRGENDDFGRVVYFTDAVFAIAMTLLVVEIGVPETIAGDANDPGALFDAFADKGPLVFAFFLGCYVIGSYWVAHHRFISWLGAVDRGFLALTVVYLSFVALLPFPTGVLGEFGENPTSVVAFALNMGAVSTMEAVLFRHARRRSLFRQKWPEDVYRRELRASLSPVLMFALSVPVAFVAARLAVVMWLLAIPLGMLLGRRRPADAGRYAAWNSGRVSGAACSAEPSLQRRSLRAAPGDHPTTSNRILDRCSRARAPARPTPPPAARPAGRC